jgi:hypothetical protein
MASVCPSRDPNAWAVSRAEILYCTVTKDTDGELQSLTVLSMFFYGVVTLKHARRLFHELVETYSFTSCPTVH